MTIYPAIDLYQGCAVRLERGDYSRVTVYSDDPVAVAKGFKASGAVCAHIIDLEGARGGTPVSFGIISRIASETGLFIQTGGGIRSAEDIEKYLNAGIKRVILGTAAVSSPGFLEEAARRFGDAVAVSADIKDGRIAIRGWVEVSELDALSFCRAVADAGVKTLICTDISKDGLLQGTNMELYKTLRGMTQTRLIASGGITSLDEVRALSELGMDGAILGKSLYAGTIRLADAIKVCNAI